MRIFAGFPGEGVKRGVVENGNFSSLSRAISSVALEVRPTLLILFFVNSSSKFSYLLVQTASLYPSWPFHCPDNT